MDVELMTSLYIKRVKKLGHWKKNPENFLMFVRQLNRVDGGHGNF